MKSSKYDLRRVVGEEPLTFERSYTLFAQIEAILNSRPLSPLSTDPNDINPITPSHFLIGKSLTSIPHGDITAIPENSLDLYQRIKQMRQNFWKRWYKEYFSELQQRVKWKVNQGNLETGDHVIVKDDSLPPQKWYLGRVIEKHPGAKKITCVVSVKTSTGVVKNIDQNLPSSIECINCGIKLFCNSQPRFRFVGVVS